MTSEKRYEMLRYLPSSGQMYIPVPGTGDECYSEKYAVRFYKDDGSDWVANFQSGYGELETVIEMADQALLLVVVYGLCYLMNPNSAEPLATFGGGYNQLLHSHDGKLILYGDNGLTIFKQDGSYDELDLYFDGIRDVSIQNNILKGSTCDYTDIWTPFEYNIDTKELNIIGGNWHYHPNVGSELKSEPFLESFPFPLTPVKKPWWKFW